MTECTNLKRKKKTHRIIEFEDGVLEIDAKNKNKQKSDKNVEQVIMDYAIGHDNIEDNDDENEDDLVIPDELRFMGDVGVAYWDSLDLYEKRGVLVAILHFDEFLNIERTIGFQKWLATYQENKN
tara:strand:+ start:176 stop:550 length:375 start_codon:yes stop_codon:yes gene_type:complete